MKTVQVQIPDNIERILDSVSDDNKSFILEAVKEKLNRITNNKLQKNLSIKFNQLACKVIEDCMMVSSPTNIALHSSYQKIIGMGEAAIPLLIKELDNNPTFWFWALQAISGLDPVHKTDKGKTTKMVKCWKKWAKENNYV